MKIKVLKNGDVVLSPEGREKNFEKALRKKAEWVSKKPVVIPYHDHYEYVYCVKIAGVDGLFRYCDVHFIRFAFGKSCKLKMVSRILDPLFKDEYFAHINEKLSGKIFNGSVATK